MMVSSLVSRLVDEPIDDVCSFLTFAGPFPLPLLLNEFREHLGWLQLPIAFSIEVSAIGAQYPL